MAIRYTRDDVTLTIGSAGDDQVRIRIEHDGATYDQIFAAEYARSPTFVNSLQWWTPARDAVQHASGGEWALNRLVIRVQDPTWAAVDWEAALRAVDPTRQPLLVRVSDVCPRSAGKLFDVPARVLEIGGPLTVEQGIRETLGESHAAFALTVGATGIADAQGFVERAMWPTTDIIHVHAHPLGLPGMPETPGTLAADPSWFLRKTSRWQTRLLVLEGFPADLPRLRQTAQRIVDAAGPAVLVGSAMDAVELYGSLLHDRPFDWLLQKVGSVALFAGAGREEALRFSNVGARLIEPRTELIILDWARTSARLQSVSTTTPNFDELVDEIANTMRLWREGATLQLNNEPDVRLIRFGDLLANRLLDMGWATGPLDTLLLELGRTTGVTTSELAQRLSQSAIPVDALTPLAFSELVTSRLANVRDSFPTFEFEDHESHGTLPMAAKATGLRKLLQAGGADVVAETPRPPRYVNSAFHRMRDDGGLKQIPQEAARLTPESVVHLGVYIGSRDPLMMTIGDLMFADEAIEWTEEMTGTWIEVAVTGIDFDVLGNPVQKVWLPRDADTDLVAFAVRPRIATAVPGVARLRFTLFHRNNIVQSFITAALLTTFHGRAEPALALALATEPEEIRDPDLGYVTRLEYSVVDPDDRVADLEPRELSIIANESAGQKIFTIKGTEFFSESLNANVQGPVDRARAALRRASLNKANEYRYDEHNAGEESDLLDLLWDVAEEGWRIYNAVLTDSEKREEVSSLLGLTDGTIHAGHINLSDVVPWSLIYDRKVDPRMRTWSEDPEDGSARVFDVTHALCPATLPAADGTIPKIPCEQDPNCILHEAHLATLKAAGGPIVRPETVICPRRFWGFAHQIEVPAQQTRKASASTTGLRTVIKSVNPAAVVVGFNPNVKRYKDHRDEIEAAISKSGKAKFRVPASMARDAILQILALPQADIVYLYCHAYFDTADKPGTQNPNLDFGARAHVDLIFPSDLEGPRWLHAPLVFLNGCGTVGFSPAAPSEFVTQFIQGRHASAVIGTEVTVWEDLAAEVGREFLRDFLNDTSAGEALLIARRRLLAKYNPLGLVYTLYGSANLHLDVPV